jgi:hypothetical protein
VFVPGEDVKVVDHTFERRDDVLFGTTKGGEAELRERLLDLAQLEVAKSQVVNQVCGTESVGRKDALEGVGRVDVTMAHLLTEYLQLFGEFANGRGVVRRHWATLVGHHDCREKFRRVRGACAELSDVERREPVVDLRGPRREPSGAISKPEE